jgi:hypothetical protein
MKKTTHVSGPDPSVGRRLQYEHVLRVKRGCHLWHLHGPHVLGARPANTKHSRAVRVVRVVVVHVLKAGRLAARKDDHPSSKHLDKVPRFASLHDAHLSRLSAHVVVELDGADGGGGALVLARFWGAIHQLLSIILKLRILVLLPVSNMPYVVKVKNYSLIGE